MGQMQCGCMKNIHAKNQKIQEGNFELICVESNVNVGYNIFILGLSKTWLYLFIYLFIAMGQSKMPIPKTKQKNFEN
jgi:hypothetical protein